MSDARVIGGRYRIETLLGEGGMGSVHRAWDERLQRAVALKLVKPGPPAYDSRAYLARALREARSVAALSHPGIVAVHDVGDADGVPFVVMELVDGASLRERLAAAAEPLEIRVRSLVDVARALHAAGLVHRDVKPDNVMVRVDGAVKVLDFGIARQTEVADASLAATAAAATMEGAVAGTPAYMAPEQVRGEALDGRADQFAWGVLAYELLTGRLPWNPASTGLGALISCVLAEPASGPLARSGMRSPEAVAIDAVVVRAPEKARDHRFASMAEAASALERAARSASAGAMAETELVRPPSKALRIVDAPLLPSYDEAAVSAYRSALQSLRDSDWGAAKGELERAVERAPHAAPALLRLPPLYTFDFSLTSNARARDPFRSAMKHRGDLSPRDRAMLHALEPMVSFDPPDRHESARRFQELRVEHADDAELQLVSAIVSRDDDKDCGDRAGDRARSRVRGRLVHARDGPRAPRAHGRRAGSLQAVRRGESARDRRVRRARGARSAPR